MQPTTMFSNCQPFSKHRAHSKKKFLLMNCKFVAASAATVVATTTTTKYHIALKHECVLFNLIFIWFHFTSKSISKHEVEVLESSSVSFSFAHILCRFRSLHRKIAHKVCKSWIANHRILWHIHVSVSFVIFAIGYFLCSFKFYVLKSIFFYFRNGCGCV